MPKITTHRELRVWLLAVELAVSARELTRRFPREERFALTDQICRASRSVAANIAEGFGRFSAADFGRYLSYALGEIAEVDTHLEVAIRCLICSADQAAPLQVRYEHLRRMIRRLKSSLRR